MNNGRLVLVTLNNGYIITCRDELPALDALLQCWPFGLDDSVLCPLRQPFPHCSHALIALLLKW